jgi:hypothetical protein
MSGPLAPKPSPLVGEGAEPRSGEAGEGGFLMSVLQTLHARQARGAEKRMS